MKVLIVSLLLTHCALAELAPEKEWTVAYREGRWKIQVWCQQQTACMKLVQLAPGPEPEVSLNDYPPGYRDGTGSYQSGPFTKSGDHYRLALTKPAPGTHRFEVFCFFRKLERNTLRTDPQAMQVLRGWTHRF